MGIDPEAVGPGDVRRGQHGFQTRRLGNQPGKIPKGEARAGMGRADHPQPERVLRRRIGTIEFAATDLGHPVGLDHARTHRLADLRRRHGPAARHRTDRLDDLLIAGAAAEHAAQGILDRRLVGPGIALQQVRRRHQHARRADAALGRAMIEEGLLQGRHAGQIREPFDRGDRLAGELSAGHQTGAELFAVHQHGAGTAVAGIAAHLGAGEAQAVAQGGAEPLARIDLQADRAPVEGEGQRGRGHLAVPHGAGPGAAASRSRQRRRSCRAASER